MLYIMLLYWWVTIRIIEPSIKRYGTYLPLNRMMKYNGPVIICWQDRILQIQTRRVLISCIRHNNIYNGDWINKFIKPINGDNVDLCLLLIVKRLQYSRYKLFYRTLNAPNLDRNIIVAKSQWSNEKHFVCSMSVFNKIFFLMCRYTGM